MTNQPQPITLADIDTRITRYRAQLALVEARKPGYLRVAWKVARRELATEPSPTRTVTAALVIRAIELELSYPLPIKATLSELRSEWHHGLITTEEFFDMTGQLPSVNPADYHDGQLPTL